MKLYRITRLQVKGGLLDFGERFCSPWKRAILCMRSELSAIHADNYIVPILTI